MRKLLTNRIFILSMLLALILVVAATTAGERGGANPIRNILSLPLTPLQKAFGFVAGKVEDTVGWFRSIGEAETKNAELTARVAELEEQLGDLEQITKQNQELRDALNFRDLFADYRIVGGNIIAKDPGNWFEIFTLDQGLQAGVRTNCPVATAYGLVGRVSRVDALTSRVVSIIDMDSTVSVRVARTRDLLVLRGDVKLKADGLCRVDYLSPSSDIEPGDTLETSGLGGIYPKGIMVGTIEQILNNEGQYDSYAIVRPSVDFRRLEEVLVMIAESDANAAAVDGTGADSGAEAETGGDTEETTSSTGD